MEVYAVFMESQTRIELQILLMCPALRKKNILCQLRCKHPPKTFDNRIYINPAIYTGRQMRSCSFLKSLV